MSLCIKNASLKLGDKTLLNDISLTIDCGCFTMILGPNGTGKSSLLKVINGELAKKTQVEFYGKCRKLWQAEKLARSVAVLPQSSSLSFNFTVQEVVELGGLVLTASKAQITQFAIENMERTGVIHLANRDYPTLSGGEKQRVHLARVLTQVSQAEKPAFIMLDEPTSALDLAHQHHVLTLLKTLSMQGAGVIAVIHDLNLAAQYADRIILLNDGKIIADGDAKNVLTPKIIQKVYHYSIKTIVHPELGFPLLIP